MNKPEDKAPRILMQFLSACNPHPTYECDSGDIYTDHDSEDTYTSDTTSLDNDQVNVGMLEKSATKAGGNK